MNCRQCSNKNYVMVTLDDNLCSLCGCSCGGCECQNDSNIENISNTIICLQCSSKKYVITTQCQHWLCIECLISLKETKCPKCNKELLGLPNKIVTCISNNKQTSYWVDGIDRSDSLDASDFY